MKFLVKYELTDASPEDEEMDGDKVIGLVRDLPWKEEMTAAEENAAIPSLDIINMEEKRILSLSAMDEGKAEILFTVESMFVGKLQRGKTGALINDVPLSRVIEIVGMFSRGEYSTIEQMDNTGLISKLIRKVLFLFADDD